MVAYPPWPRSSGKNSDLEPVSWPTLDRPPPSVSDLHSDANPEVDDDSAPSTPDSTCFFSPLLSDEGEYDAIDTLVWPTKREHCAWVTSKVTQDEGKKRTASERGSRKRREIDSGVFRDEIVSYGEQPPPQSSHNESRSQYNKRQRGPKKRSRARSTFPKDVTSTGAKRKDSTASSSVRRPPLRDITALVDNGGQTSGTSSTMPSFSSSRTTSTEMEQALHSLLGQSEDGRSVSTFSARS